MEILRGVVLIVLLFFFVLNKKFVWCKATADPTSWYEFPSIHFLHRLIYTGSWGGCRLSQGTRGTPWMRC